MNAEYLDFEVEVPNVEAAVEQVAAIRKAFGDEVCVTVKIVGGDKSKVLTTLDEAIKKTAAELAAKLRREK